jgi:hypothetical protein
MRTRQSTTTSAVQTKLNGNFQINPLENNDEDVDTIKYVNNRGGDNRGYQGGSSQFRGGGQGRYNSQTHNNRGGQDNAARGGYYSNQNTVGDQNPNMQTSATTQRGCYTNR